MKSPPQILEYRSARVSRQFDTGWVRRAMMHLLAAGAFLVAAIALALFVATVWAFATSGGVSRYDRASATIVIIVTLLVAFLFVRIGVQLLNASAA